MTSACFTILREAEFTIRSRTPSIGVSRGRHRRRSSPPSPMQDEPPPQGPASGIAKPRFGPNTDSLYSPSSPASPTPQISNDSMLSKRLRARRTTGQPCRTPAPMLQPATARHHGRNRWRLIPWKGSSTRARSPFTR